MFINNKLDNKLNDITNKNNKYKNDKFNMNILISKINYIILENEYIIQFTYQLFCLLLLALIYKNNIYILDIIKKIHINNNYSLSYYIIYYKSFLLSFIFITFVINYIWFVKSINNFNKMKGLIIFVILQFFLLINIFNDIDIHILNLENFVENRDLILEEETEEEPEEDMELSRNIKSIPNVADYNKVNIPISNGEKITDDSGVYLLRHNKPEHYDFTPDNIPQWKNDEDLLIAFKELKDKWDKDPNKKYRNNIRAYDKYKLPYMEGGFEITHPINSVKMFNLFEMDKEHNKMNKSILQALESNGYGYDKEFIHNTEHLRRHNNKLKKLQHHNKSKHYFDPDNIYINIKDFPNPDISSLKSDCTNENENENKNKKIFKDYINNIIHADLQGDYNDKSFLPNKIYKSKYEPKNDVNNKKNDIKLDNLTIDDDVLHSSNFKNIEKICNEYSYSSDEINTVVLNKKDGKKKFNTKSKNINQYCTNYDSPDNEQLRLVSDNNYYDIYSHK
jgi:hypothetical protein